MMQNYTHMQYIRADFDGEKVFLEHCFNVDNDSTCFKVCETDKIIIIITSNADVVVNDEYVGHIGLSDTGHWVFTGYGIDIQTGNVDLLKAEAKIVKQLLSSKLISHK